MCGIFFKYGAVDYRDITCALDTMRHRGPDDEGLTTYDMETGVVDHFYGEDTPLKVRERFSLNCSHELKTHPLLAVLGHRRLAIQDLSPNAHQPAVHKNLIMSYNGEIYNGQELQKKFSLYDLQDKYLSDTLLLIEGFSKIGEEFIHHLRGMFAIIFLDTSKNIISIYRDRFGIKPLYYYLDKELIVASEIKAITQLLPKISYNKRAIENYLFHAQMDTSNETFFSKVYSLEAGQKLIFDLKKEKMEISPWYVPRMRIEENTKSLSKAVTSYKNLFLRSIKEHLISDVKLAACVSGGLDSSSVVCSALITEPEKITKIFTNRSRIQKYDEFHYLESVLQQYPSLQVHENEILLDEIEVDTRALIKIHDEPPLSPSAIAEWKLYKIMAKNEFKVSIEGHGADELLLGYRVFRPYIYYDLLITDYREFGKNFARAPLKILIELSKLIYRSIGRRRKPQISQQESFFATANEVSRLQLQCTSIPKQLKWTDRSSMAHSIEARVPFLDHELVEYTLSLPTKWKFRNGFTKYILRESMKGILPEKIRSRQSKLGFVTASDDWIENDTKRILDLLNVYKSDLKEFFNRSDIERLLSGSWKRGRDRNFVWRVYFLMVWYDENFKSKT